MITTLYTTYTEEPRARVSQQANCLTSLQSIKQHLVVQPAVKLQPTCVVIHINNWTCFWRTQAQKRRSTRKVAGKWWVCPFCFYFWVAASSFFGPPRLRVNWSRKKKSLIYPLRFCAFAWILADNCAVKCSQIIWLQKSPNSWCLWNSEMFGLPERESNQKILWRKVWRFRSCLGASIGLYYATLLS